MSHDERLATAEEWLMRLQRDHEQLDRVLQAQGRALADLREHLVRLERRLERLEPDAE